MKQSTYYLDTNIFLYAADVDSPYHKDCRNIIIHADTSTGQDPYYIVTSTEVIQEIVHVSQRLGLHEKGLKIAALALKHCQECIAIDLDVVAIYLQLMKKHPTAMSRDIIQVAVCLNQGIQKIITCDKDFDTFKELQILTPSKAVDEIYSQLK